MTNRQTLLDIYKQELKRAANHAERTADMVGSNNIGLANQLYSTAWAVREYIGQITEQERLNVNDE